MLVKLANAKIAFRCVALWIHSYPLSITFKDNFVSIGNRLREERERLGFSQAGFAEITGTHRKSQGNYELGERAPDADYLAAIAAAGADVLYILTGQRGAPPALSREEECFLDNWRHSPKDAQESMKTMCAALAQSKSVKKSKAA